MKTMRRVGVVVGTVLVGTGILGWAESASAHTPAVNASCSGVHLAGTAYDAGQANRWSATVNGETTSGTFGGTLDETIPVAQGGRTSSWSVTIEAFNGEYRLSKSGTVGPCGTPPVPEKPADQVETDEVPLTDCDDLTVTLTTSTRVTPYVLDQETNTWMLGEPGDWVEVTSSSRAATLQECPAPPRPEPVVTQMTAQNQKCGEFFATIVTWTSTTDHVLDESTRTWLPAEPVTVTTTSVEPATVVECPATLVDRPVEPRYEQVLPSTGGPSWLHGVVGGVLLVGGAVVLLAQRRRTV